jgi:hypothetical protein
VRERDLVRASWTGVGGCQSWVFVRLVQTVRTGKADKENSDLRGLFSSKDIFCNWGNSATPKR